MTAREFLLWLNSEKAKRGSRFTYYEGTSLAAASGGDHPPTRDHARVKETAVEAYAAYKAGLVHLVQARIRDGGRGFEYIAIKRI
jgi:hypothetical protein